MAIGDYPKEYNPSVHGPYDPARYYGKRKCRDDVLPRPSNLVLYDYVIFS